MPTFEKSGRVVTEYHEAHGLLGPASEEPLLHPDTAPEVVAARQRNDVLVAWGAGLSDPEQIGRALVLPARSVRRYLFELGLGPNPTPARRRPTAKDAGYASVEAEAKAKRAALDRGRADRIAAALAGGPLTILQLVAATGLRRWQVARAVVGNRRFEVAGRVRGPKGGPAAVYGVKAG